MVRKLKAFKDHQVKQVDISESTDVNQSISINRFYPIKALISIREFFSFPIIHHNSIFSTHVKSLLFKQVKNLTFVL